MGANDTEILLPREHQPHPSRVYNHVKTYVLIDEEGFCHRLLDGATAVAHKGEIVTSKALVDVAMTIRDHKDVVLRSSLATFPGSMMVILKAFPTTFSPLGQSVRGLGKKSGKDGCLDNT